nr:unnamed protein product [Callosobruchus analis]
MFKRWKKCQSSRTISAVGLREC